MNLTQKQFLNNFLATHILLKFPVGVKLSSASFFSLFLNKFRAEKMNDGWLEIRTPYSLAWAKNWGKSSFVTSILLMTYEDDEWIIPNELLQSWAVEVVGLFKRNQGIQDFPSPLKFTFRTTTRDTSTKYEMIANFQ